MNRSHRFAAAIVASLLAAPCLAQAPNKAAASKPAAKSGAKSKPAANPVDDLTTPAVRHVATCPLPKTLPCVIKKPVEAGYRLLTTGVDIEDKNGQWIADFSKAPSSPKMLLRVLGLNGDLHEIEVSFRNRPAAKARPAQK